MDLLSVLILAGLAVWFAAAVRYLWRHRGGCSCCAQGGKGASGCAHCRKAEESGCAHCKKAEEPGCAHCRKAEEEPGCAHCQSSGEVQILKKQESQPSGR